MNNSVVPCWNSVINIKQKKSQLILRGSIRIFMIENVSYNIISTSMIKKDLDDVLFLNQI